MTGVHHLVTVVILNFVMTTALATKQCAPLCCGAPSGRELRAFAQVQILRAEPLGRYIRLGEIRAQPSSEGADVTRIEIALLKEAAKMGADAAVWVFDRPRIPGDNVKGPCRERSVQVVQGRIVIGVAIMYQ